MDKQKIEELKNKVKTAVHLFLTNDMVLLDLKVYESAVSHRIAVHLEKLFRGFSVDCEYNKYFVLPKATSNGKEIRPDILVHRRKADDDNVLVIEIKKNRRSNWDENKLKELTKQNGKFGYNLGIFIYFPNGEPKYKWFVDGEEINLN